jgi:hypothetical protein
MKNRLFALSLTLAFCFGAAHEAQATESMSWASATETATNPRYPCTVVRFSGAVKYGTAYMKKGMKVTDIGRIKFSKNSDAVLLRDADQKNFYIRPAAAGESAAANSLSCKANCNPIIVAVTGPGGTNIILGPPDLIKVLNKQMKVPLMKSSEMKASEPATPTKPMKPATTLKPSVVAPAVKQ